MVTVILLVEGGGDNKTMLRRYGDAFRQLLIRTLGDERAKKINVRLCGGRGSAFDDYRLSLKQKSAPRILLLVDSEGPVDEDHSPWRHVQLNRHDRWERPAGAGEQDLHFMHQCMEAWVLAGSKSYSGKPPSSYDKDKALAELKKLFGPNYRKTDGFDKLAAADPARIAKCCPRFGKRFFDEIKQATA